ncbi:MAG TPA: site-specific integrase [Vicinamibacterales bacterium]
MNTRGTRRLRDGREVDVGRNDGLRKVCGCGRHKWPKCPHPWHFNFQWEGQHYRFSLDRHLGKKVTKNVAEVEAERLRTAIRAGEFQAAQARAHQPKPPQETPMTFRQFAEDWRARRGYQLVRPGDNDSRLKLICAFMVPGTDPPLMFGDKAVAEITTGDIEAYRHHRRMQKRSAVTINHDLKLLRKMFAWGIRERALTATPFRVAGENVIRLDPESPREERLTDPEAERKLFRAASPHLRGVITAMLETCCRPGEILSLQWQDVDLETRELTIRAEKAKTRRARRLPISSRLVAILEMRRLDPTGKPFQPEAYVFGNRLGQRVKSIRTAWENAREAAGLDGFQLRDLRHEAASRFEEAGVLTTDVSKFLGHRNLSTTTRYLNTTSRRLRLALLRVEQAREDSERLANSCKDAPESGPHTDDAEASSTPSKSLPS